MVNEKRSWNDEMYKKHPTPYSGLAGIVERARANAILKYIDIGPNDTVLEVGCEAGNLLKQLPSAQRIVGADISAAALSDAKMNFNNLQRSAEFIECDAEDTLPFAKGEFSVIICSEMLEHVNDPDKVVANLVKIADADTRIVITVPNEGPKIRLKKALSTMGLMKIIMPNIEAEQSEWHIQAFSKETFEELLTRHLNIVELRMLLGLHIIARCHL